MCSYSKYASSRFLLLGSSVGSQLSGHGVGPNVRVVHGKTKGDGERTANANAEPGVVLCICPLLPRAQASVPSPGRGLVVDGVEQHHDEALDEEVVETRGEHDHASAMIHDLLVAHLPPSFDAKVGDHEDDGILGVPGVERTSKHK